MNDRITQQQVNQAAWAACDTFRGAVDPAQYKDYILVMLFLKYISDLWNDHVQNYRKQYGKDDKRIRRRLERERFILPEGSSFYDLYEQRNEANIGELINIALEKIEDTNRAKLEGVFRNIDFNSESNLGRVKDRNRRLKNMLEDFAKPALDLNPRRVTEDVIGECYIYLISRFASDAGQEGRRILYSCGCLAAAGQACCTRSPADTICDPACGSGSLSDSRSRRSWLGQLCSLRPGGQWRHLGAGPHEHVPALQGCRPHRVVRHAQQPGADRKRPPDEVRCRGRQSALLPRQVGRRTCRGRPIQPLLARHSAQVEGRLRHSSRT